MLLFIFFAIPHIAINISMKLSVFVVTYNQEEFIKRALDSVLMQKVSFNYEIIIGEDCSTDSTPQICDEYAAKYPFIRVYHHKQNKGLVKNWEFVFNHCRGEYVAMLEGDDFWLSKNKLQKQVEWLDEHPDFVITSTNVRVISKCTEGVLQWFANRKEGDVEPIEYLNPGIAQTSSVVIRNVTKDITYPHWMYVTDTYTFLWICNFGKAYHFEEEMSVYWRHDGNVTESKQYMSDVVATMKWAKQHRMMQTVFPQYAKELLVYEEQELKELSKISYKLVPKNVWTYRVRYMWLHKELCFSKYMLKTIQILLWPR